MWLALSLGCYKWYQSQPSNLCGLGHMGPNEDVRDLSGGDCDAPKSDKCMCAESHIGHILGRTGLY
jgi:hypothetical protein